jgi:hypothetical protein
MITEFIRIHLPLWRISPLSGRGLLYIAVSGHPLCDGMITTEITAVSTTKFRCLLTFICGCHTKQHQRGQPAN